MLSIRLVLVWLTIAALAAGLALPAAGCESCQSTERDESRQLVRSLEIELCAEGSYYRDCMCGEGAMIECASPREFCHDEVLPLLRYCGNMFDEPEGFQRWGPSPREALLRCVNFIFVPKFYTFVQTPSERCEDRSRWPQLPRRNLPR